MPDENVEIGLNYAIGAFNAIMDTKGRPFGSTAVRIRGVSDGRQGVQWSIGVNLNDAEARMTLNLEGMKYDGWPIATFIENERKRSMLVEIVPHVKGAMDIWVTFYRDAWQATSRPRINEKVISQTRLSELTPTAWNHTLEEAYACLDSGRNHRGRARQWVTLSKQGAKEMDVSPHLQIYTKIWDSTPKDENVARSLVLRGLHTLSPLYSLLRNQAGEHNEGQ